TPMNESDHQHASDRTHGSDRTPEVDRTHEFDRTHESDRNQGQETRQPGVEEIEADIERTRAELAATVEALTDRLDVKSRLRGKVEHTKRDAVQRVHTARSRATDQDGRPTPPVIAGAAALVALVALLVWRRTR
ncbi:DUF3618 domain-containing protein, partial [uncultured Nocardioides sp.]|uniref:DUF3618 domain-containing protein n=1 Tax=uncultured Nocardioides sp. TaxID=198441 RepID=UPI0025F8A743